MLAISYITAHFLFASAKYLFAQNCKAPSGVEIFDGFSQSELKPDADLARRDLAKDAKIARRRAYAFDSLRLYLRLGVSAEKSRGGLNELCLGIRTACGVILAVNRRLIGN